MKILKEKPFNYQFKHSGNDDSIPEMLGDFKSLDDAKKYINENFVSEHIKEVARRLYSDEEIASMRLEVNNELENVRPILERAFLDATSEFEAAKQKKNDAQEDLNSCINKAKNISTEIKGGWTEISLDPARSFRLALNGKYYTYVYLDFGAIVLAKISIIPEFELKNLFNSAEKNEQSFNEIFNGKKVKIKKG